MRWHDSRKRATNRRGTWHASRLAVSIDEAQMLFHWRRHDAQWSSTGLTGNVKIEVSRNGGASWAPISPSTPNDGAFTWTVAGPASRQARVVRITSLTDLTVVDASNASATIQCVCRSTRCT
jgi:hypothetical protein